MTNSKQHYQFGVEVKLESSFQGSAQLCNCFLGNPLWIE